MPLSLTDPIGNFLIQQVKQYRSQIYDYDKAEYWGLNPAVNFVTSIPDLPIGLESVQAFSRERFGEASIYNYNSSDIPVVSVQLGKLPPTPALVFITSAIWNRFDLDRQRVANNSGLMVPSINLFAEYLAGIADFINRREHYHLLYGNAPNGTEGLYNISGVLTLTDEDGEGDPIGELYDSSEVNPVALYDIFLSWISKFKRESLVSATGSISLAVPERLMRRLAEPYSTQTGVTVYEMLTDPTKGYAVGEIISHEENSGDVLNANILKNGVAYPADEDRIIFKVSGGTPTIQRHLFPRLTLPPFQRSSLDYEMVGFSATTGLFVPRKNRMMYVDFSNTVTP